MKKLEVRIGEVFGKREVVSGAFKYGKRKARFVKCKCSCGKIDNILLTRLVARKSDSCMTCSKDSSQRRAAAKGKRFGLWIVVSDDLLNEDSAIKVLCQCACKKLVKVRVSNLVQGKSKGCRECRVHRHGKSKTPEYSSWASMRSRCLDTASVSYKNYGGRGISVCSRWIGDNGFDNFISDMGRRPSQSHSLDRIDNNANYDKSNCRWATPKEQSRKRRSVVLSVEMVREIRKMKNNGMKVVDICRKLPVDIKYGTVKSAANGRTWRDLT